MAKVVPMKKELTERDVAKKTLESKFWQNVVASNSYELGVKSGNRAADQWLTGAYDEVLGSEEASKLRNNIYNSRKKAYRDAGVSGEPAMPSDADLVYGGIGDIQNSLQFVGMNDLYNIMAKMDSAFKKYDLPEKGLELSLADIYSKAEEEGAIVEKDGKKGIDFEKLGAEYSEAFITLNTLNQMYQDTCQEALRMQRRSSTLEGLSKQRHEQFHPKDGTADGYEQAEAA